MRSLEVTVREVTDPRDPAIAAFGRMQDAAYFAPETLIPAAYIPRMLAGETGTRRNFLVVALVGSEVVGGIARRIHASRFAILDRTAGQAIAGVFIDVVNPLRMSPGELERELRVGSDPWARRSAFEHLGFRQVDIRYEQPVGGPDLLGPMARRLRGASRARARSPCWRRNPIGAALTCHT